MKNKKWIIISLILGVAGVGAIFILWFLSADTISPGVYKAEEPVAGVATRTVQAELTPVIQWYAAVGTVQPSSQARIEAQVAGQVNAVRVNGGDIVTAGQVLVVLDDRQLQARLSQARQALKTAVSQREQARQAVHAAEAAFAQAQSAYNRTKNFFAAKAATARDMEQAESAYLQAQAGLKRAEDGVGGTLAGIRMAEEMVVEAQIALGYTEIKAPTSGRVLQRLVDPGDQAVPGKPLLLLRTDGALRLEAHVRESLVQAVHPGAQLRVELVTLEQTVDAVVEELIPYADPHSRTFLVKAALPEIVGLYPGMYGKLKIPLQEVDLVLIPKAAITEIGQLELVMVKTPAGWKRQYIKTGKTYADKVEVLSGLFGGETLQLKESGDDRQ
ncbi:MAG: efflux RND transporter periplasmic adaptor subunit [Desulfuromonas sp.]|nr:efflux RND transporter periplasmic adaptor subunit [Desulfuromonas sp.]